MKLKLNDFLYKNNLATLRAEKWKQKQKQLVHSHFYKALSVTQANHDEYPIIDKCVFMSEFDEINTVGIRFEEANKIALHAENSRDFSPEVNGVTVGLSSGTSGNRGLFLASQEEKAVWVARVLDRVIGLSLKKRKVAFFLRANSNLYSSVSSKLLQFEYFDLQVSPDEHIGRLNRLKPEIIVAQPSMLLILAQYMEGNKLHISPSKIVSVAEVLTKEDRDLLSRVFKQTIHQVYQATEGFLASSCKCGNLHFHEDLFIIEKEYLTNSKDRFYPIITDLERSSQPVIRYKLNDIIHELKNCPCGSKHMGIKKIEGRSDDILEFNNSKGELVKIFPDFFRRAIVRSSSDVIDYNLIKVDEKSINLFVNDPDKIFEFAKQAILELLKSYGVESVKVIRMSKPQFVLGDKLRRIRNV